jgi:hypothetical protein
MVRQIALRFQIALTVNVDVEDLLLFMMQRTQHHLAVSSPNGGSARPAANSPKRRGRRDV